MCVVSMGLKPFENINAFSIKKKTNPEFRPKLYTNLDQRGLVVAIVQRYLHFKKIRW